MNMTISLVMRSNQQSPTVRLGGFMHAIELRMRFLLLPLPRNRRIGKSVIDLWLDIGTGCAAQRCEILSEFFDLLM